MANKIKWYDDPSQHTIFSIKPGQGPSKMDLLNALAYACGGEFQVPPDPMRVQFKVVRGDNVNRPQAVTILKYARILSVANENGTGESFDISGYLSDDADWRKAKTGEREFSGYYNARTRTGTIKMKNHG